MLRNFLPVLLSFFLLTISCNNDDEATPDIDNWAYTAVMYVVSPAVYEIDATGVCVSELEGDNLKLTIDMTIGAMTFKDIVIETTYQENGLTSTEQVFEVNYGTVEEPLIEEVTLTINGTLVDDTFTGSGPIKIEKITAGGIEEGTFAVTATRQ